tara:strand:- start:1410 stop:2006 length:597 start_codon:yes stop_codon:yes gene_type:complete
MIQELGTERLTEVFNNAQLIPIDANNNTQVGIIKDIFTDTELELIADVFNNGSWTEMPAQAHLGRKQIIDFYPVMRLINFIKEILPKINTLMGSDFTDVRPSLWQDAEGYKLTMHKDDFGGSEYTGAVQIYLPSSCQQSAGTRFYADNNTGPDDTVLDVPFIPNTGYICTECDNIVHSSGLPVESGLYRRSLYLILTK